MSDFERYGDYNNSPDDDDPFPKPLWRIILGKVIRWCFTLLLIFVIVFICARLIFFSYYPAYAKQLYITDEISVLFAESSVPEVLTQELRIPYEDRKDGFFYADNLIIIRESGSLQCSVRVNKSAYSSISEKYGIDINSDTPQKLTFTLYYSDGQSREIALVPDEIICDSNFLYTYYKLCFEGVDLGDSIPWYRLNIHISGVSDTEKEPVSAIAVYENHQEFNEFEKYKVSDKELNK